VTDAYVAPDLCLGGLESGAFQCLPQAGVRQSPQRLPRASESGLFACLPRCAGSPAGAFVGLRRGTAR